MCGGAVLQLSLCTVGNKKHCCKGKQLSLESVASQGPFISNQKHLSASKVPPIVKKKKNTSQIL